VKTATVSKLDLAVIVAAAGVLLWIEHGHRTIIEPPTQAEPASSASAAGCADTDNVPYSASCLAFLGSGYASRMSWRANAAEPPAPSSVATPN
jgi:hypothetical protein